MRKLKGQDAAFLYGETDAWHMHVSSLIVVDPSTSDGQFGYERLKQLLADRLPSVPQFRWKYVEVPLGLDRPSWIEDPDFDIDFHVRRIAVPAPGGPEQLGELVGRLTSYKLDRRKPLWELWVVEGLEGGRVAVLAKIHHSVIDGISGAGLAEILMDLTPEPRPAPVEVRESLHGERVRSTPELLARGLVNSFVRTPYRLARFARQSLMQSVTLAGMMRRSDRPVLPFDGPDSMFNGQFSPHRRFAAVSVPLARVKAVKDAYGVKLNDVVLALVGDSVRHYLEKRDALPEQSLITQCPVSLRSADEQDDVGNRVGSMFASLGTDCADPVERLRAIHLSTQSAKEMQEALSVHKIMGLTETSPPGLIALAARMYTSMGLRRLMPRINMVVSNVPGPPFPLYMAGARVERIYPMGPLLLDMGLNVTVFSYCDSLDFGLMSCPEMVPDVESIAEGITAALEALELRAPTV